MVMSQVVAPDVVVVLDSTLLRYDDVTSGLRSGGWLVVNSPQNPRELRLNNSFNIATADATGVCKELGLEVAGLTIVNTAILGPFVRATGMVSLASVEKAIRERFSNRAADINIAAIIKTYEITQLDRID